MNKVFNLINILDIEVVDRLVTLDRLVRFYSRFLSNWNRAEVTSDGRIVRVKFLTTNNNGHVTFTERVFPIEDIDIRISSYKSKIAKEFKERHENPRVQRSKEIHKWKTYIDHAKLHM